MPQTTMTREMFCKIDSYASSGCAIGICFEGGQPAESFFSYSANFLEVYKERDLARIDPTLDFGFNHDGIAQWGDIEKSADNAECFAVARAYGIESGVCFSMTIEGVKTIASISQSNSSPLTKDQIIEIENLLILLSFRTIRSSDRKTVAPRTLEWLHLTAEGADDAGVAKTLGLSIHGARARRRSAIAELGAKSTANAVALALRDRVITPYELV